MSGEGGSRRYEIIEALKTGGSAEVFLGLMRGENGFVREVVIKKPRAHLAAEPRFRAMFVDEAHIASRLSHPNIVQVIDLVSNPTEVYLVLEYLSGLDLRELLRRCFDVGKLPPIDVALYIAAETAAGLDHAHRATAADGAPLNIVHRDVSPKNIRLTDVGAVKLIDFGIAHAEQRITETAAGSVKGTPGYMAPEQALGEPLDRRSDVFSLGICLYQMLTGRNPFDAPELRDRMMLLFKSPTPPVSTFRADLPPGLDELVARSLARDPLERYATAAEMGRDLEQMLHGMGTASPRARLVEVLDELFPDLRQARPSLQSALAAGGEASSLPGWGDTSTAAYAQTHVPDTELRSVAKTTEVSTAPPVAPALRGRKLAPAVIMVAGLVAVGAVAASVIGGTERVEPRFDPLEPRAAPRSDPPVRTPTVAAEAPDAGVPVVEVPSKAKPKTKAKDSEQHISPEDLFRAAAALSRRGSHEDARFVYELILAQPGARAKPTVLRNLALVHRSLGHMDRMQACFRDYLELRPDAKDAARIEEMLEAGEAHPSVLCLSADEASLVRARAARVGSRLEAWVEDARE